MAQPIIVNTELHSRFKSACALKREQMKTIVESLIEKWLAENEQENESLFVKDNNISNFQQATKESA